MPIFDYLCESCGQKQERIVKSEKDNVKCYICGKRNLIRLFPDKFNFKLKGKWFKNGGY